MNPTKDVQSHLQESFILNSEIAKLDPEAAHKLTLLIQRSTLLAQNLFNNIESRIEKTLAEEKSPLALNKNFLSTIFSENGNTITPNLVTSPIQDYHKIAETSQETQAAQYKATKRRSTKKVYKGLHLGIFITAFKKKIFVCQPKNARLAIRLRRRISEFLKTSQRSPKELRKFIFKLRAANYKAF